MSALVVNEAVDFNTLKEILGATDGNLASHIKALEKIKSLSVEELIKVDSESNMRLQLDKLMEELSNLLHATSLSISNTYFNHSYQQTQLVGTTL